MQRKDNQVINGCEQLNLNKVENEIMDFMKDHFVTVMVAFIAVVAVAGWLLRKSDLSRYI